jgi:hypothetical protein
LMAVVRATKILAEVAGQPLVEVDRGFRSG